MGLFRHLQIVVVESDEAEAERHRQHDPDIGVERIGPQQRRDHEAREDHQPAHRRRALLGDQVRLRAIGADRLALALPQPQMIDDPGPEQEHEQRARDHRAAGAEGDVAKHVRRSRGRCRTRERYWKARSASKTFKYALSRGLVAPSLAGSAPERFVPANALMIVFILKPSKSWSCIWHAIGQIASRRNNSRKCGQFTPLPAGRPAAWAQTCSPRTSSCCP